MYIHIFCLLGRHCKQQEQRFFLQFAHQKHKIIQHMITPIFASSWKCYPGPLLIMSFVKVCKMWSCQQTVKKASHTRLQAQQGQLVKSYGSWCLCWSSQKVITNRYVIHVIIIKNKITIIVIIIMIVVKMLNSQFYCCKGRLVESVLVISVLQWWHLNHEQWKVLQYLTPLVIMIENLTIK